MTVTTHPGYRPDIDGLRALSIFSVVIFHAFPSVLPGGFIGVDIFFVISGYLISSIILHDLKNKQFSLLDFYHRRIRRIFPALVIVLGTCLSAGWLVLLTDEYKQLGKHVYGGTAFLINFMLLHEINYFDNAADTKPLLHLWSLSIEEQFYILWPALLMLAYRCKFNPVRLTIALLAASLLMSFFMEQINNQQAFYHPTTRFWELLVGCGLACVRSIHQNSNFPEKIPTSPHREISILSQPIARSILSIVGLALIMLGLVTDTPSSSYQSSLVIVPVIGAALLLATGKNAWVNKNLLSRRAMIWLGLISYPLYLWHWPLLAFARIFIGEQPAWPIRAAALVIAVILAWLTYMVVERKIRFNPKPRPLIPILMSLMITCGVTGYIIDLNNGFSHRLDSWSETIDGDTGQYNFYHYMTHHYQICTPAYLAAEAQKYDDEINCRQSQSSKNIDIALIGDSHAEHLFIGLSEALPQKNIAYYSQQGKPILSNPAFTNILKTVSEKNSFNTIILTMFWVNKFSPQNPKDQDELTKTISYLSRSKQVYIIDAPPFLPFDPKQCKGRRWIGASNKCTMDASTLNEFNNLLLEKLHKIAKDNPNVKIIKISNILCNAKTCSITQNRKVLYRDWHHLNIEGSRLVGKKIVENYPTLFQ